MADEEVEGTPDAAASEKRSYRERKRPKDLGDGVLRCAYGECLAPLDRTGSLYCHPEHARLAKIRTTLEARAQAAYRHALEAALDPMQPSLPPPIRGWVVTERGAVLAAQDMTILRAQWGALLGKVLDISEEVKRDKRFRDLLPLVESLLREAGITGRLLSAVTEAPTAEKDGPAK